jgi:hypothetical protein
MRSPVGAFCPVCFRDLFDEVLPEVVLPEDFAADFPEVFEADFEEGFLLAVGLL